MSYFLVYLCSSILAIITTLGVIHLSRRFNLVDVPGIRKVHCEPVPRIGGVAIFTSAIAIMVPAFLLVHEAADSFLVIRLRIVVLLSAASFIFFVGLVDDIRGLRSRTKLLAQLLGALAVCSVGIRINSVTFTNTFTVGFGWFSWPITVLWIVGITNAINLVDGLDGLAAGISWVTCGVISVLSLCFGPPAMTVMMFSLLGALTGFLLFNFNPAKIFMGDSGSLFLGFMISSSSVLCGAKTETVVGLALPFLALGIPIFDTLFSMLRRFLERRSIFSADYSHFHHRLLALGLHQRHVVIVSYVMTVLATGFRYVHAA